MGRREDSVAELEEDGFEVREDDEGFLTVRCDDCEALVTNGVATHELNCPTWVGIKRERSLQEQLDLELA